jgi:hypothetical protein
VFENGFAAAAGDANANEPTIEMAAINESERLRTTCLPNAQMRLRQRQPSGSFGRA